MIGSASTSQIAKKHIETCPSCGSINYSDRSIYNPRAEPQYHCRDCGTGFNKPAIREISETDASTSI